MTGSSLDRAMERMFPTAVVERHPFDDTYRVSITVQTRELVSARHDSGPVLSSIASRLTPSKPRRRRLHYGRKH